MRKHILRILKIAVPLAVIAWLLTAIEPAQWFALRDCPKNWGLISCAFALALAAVCLSFVRWYLLVRAIELQFGIADAFRLSFLGYLFNFVAAGNVGGDLFKAYFIAREQPHRKTEAVATVVVDRLIGLYALLLVASANILAGGGNWASPTYRAIANITLLATAAGGIGVMLLMIPGFTKGFLTRRLASLPYVGASCERLVVAMRMYRDKRLLTAGIFGLSMLVHVMLAVAMFMIAHGLFDTAPTLTDHMSIVPLSLVAAALPISPSGLGSYELAMDKLYQVVPSAVSASASGLLIALVYRLITISIAGVGLVYYWLYRTEVRFVTGQEAR